MPSIGMGISGPESREPRFLRDVPEVELNEAQKEMISFITETALDDWKRGSYIIDQVTVGEHIERMKKYVENNPEGWNKTI